MNLRNISAALIVLFLCIWFTVPCKAADGYVVHLQESSITCFVKYSLVGKYSPEFKDFNGLIYFDPKDLSKSSVYLKIKTDSLKSKYSTLDRMARSKRLLNAKRYPDVVFQSKKIEKRTDGYYVTGELILHGVTRNFTFPLN